VAKEKAVKRVPDVKELLKAFHEMGRIVEQTMKIKELPRHPLKKTVGSHLKHLSNIL
jgi:hypothetical protein